MTGLYVHVPFCKKKCNYCNFYSISEFSADLMEAYLDAVIVDITSYNNPLIDTIYIGGGTPSIIPVRLMDKFLAKLFGSVTYRSEEFSFELNPESASYNYLELLKSFGVSRVSLGVQSTDNKILKFLGRIHSKKEIYTAVDYICKLFNADEMSMDIIYDIPTVSFDKIKKTLDDVIALSPGHISAYSYAFDTDFLTAFDKKDEGNPYQFSFIKHYLEERGYRKYEISNFARDRHKCKHNMRYWLMENYIGVGCGAHSMTNTDTGRIRKAKCKDIEQYTKNPLSFDNSLQLSNLEAAVEHIVFGLRMLGGIDLLEIEKRYKKIPFEIIKKIEYLVEDGLLYFSKGNLLLLDKGERVFDSVMEYLWC